MEKEKAAAAAQVAGSNDEGEQFCQLKHSRNELLTTLGEPPLNQEDAIMATDPLAKVRNEIGLRVAEIRDAGPRLSPLDLYARMDAIRHLAAVNGLATQIGRAHV